MGRLRLLVLLFGCGLFPANAYSDVGPFAVPDFNLVNGGFQFHPVLNVAGGRQIYGFSLEADWTGLSGTPRSDELRLFSLLPGGGAASALSYGGTATGNPFRFEASRFLAIPQGVGSGGNWTLAFANPSIITSTASLTNVSVTLLNNPVSTYQSDTTDGALWTRPTEAFAGLSPFGETRYHKQAFTVNQSGRYDIFSSQGFDGFVFLYAGAFNPQSPLQNGLSENDDGRTGPGSSDAWLDVTGAPLELLAGTTYYLVTTGFNPSDSGAFTNYIGGVGNVTFVPEPSSFVLLGCLAVATVRRRGR
ncbi:MAG: hypothetical protein GXP29_00980 [Planctomycetes bacterium]|nr:hypothetical protein [Planctomycetota bacterium]